MKDPVERALEMISSLRNDCDTIAQTNKPAVGVYMRMVNARLAMIAMKLEQAPVPDDAEVDIP